MLSISTSPKFCLLVKSLHFANDTPEVHKMMIFLFDRVENIERKKENASFPKETRGP